MTSFYDGKVVEIDYTNWKGERRWRRVVPRDVWFGISRWHHERQWFMRGWCLESGEQREFCMATIHGWREASDQSLPWRKESENNVIHALLSVTPSDRVITTVCQIQCRCDMWRSDRVNTLSRISNNESISIVRPFTPYQPHPGLELSEVNKAVTCRACLSKMGRP